MKPKFVRGIRVADAAAVDALLRDVFGGAGEAGLVQALRASGEMSVEVVMPWEGRIFAHVGLARMVAPQGWLCLASLCVADDWRGRDIGVRMAKGAVALAVGRTVVVLGKPSVYTRAGFSGARAVGLQSACPIRKTLIARGVRPVRNKSILDVSNIRLELVSSPKAIHWMAEGAEFAAARDLYDEYEPVDVGLHSRGHVCAYLRGVRGYRGNLASGAEPKVSYHGSRY